MSHQKRVDANQSEIVNLFRQLGARVYVASGVGGGFPDLVIQYHFPQRRWHSLETLLVEIKDGSLSPSRRQLTAEQKVFHSIFNCHIVECEDDVYTLLGINKGD